MSKGAALYHYQEACRLEFEYACEQYKNLRVELDEFYEKKSIPILTESDSSRAYNELIMVAQSYYKDKNFNKAIKFYTKAYKLDSSKFNYFNSLDIANTYFNKVELNNLDSAAKWYAISLNLMENDPKMNYNIGTKHWFDDKYTDALFNYANAIRNKNGKLAIDAYLKAVRNGYTGAYTQIGQIYELGNGGVEIDFKIAADFYEKDAEKKAAKAMYCLGKLYEKGGPNLEQSDRKSERWFERACKTDVKFCK